MKGFMGISTRAMTDRLEWRERDMINILEFEELSGEEKTHK